MTYISGSRADQWNAEDRQASVMLTHADARLLTGLDEIVTKLQAMREDNCESNRDALLAEMQKMARDMSNNVADGWE